MTPTEIGAEIQEFLTLDPFIFEPVVLFVIGTVVVIVVWLLGKPFMELWVVYMKAGRLSLVKAYSGENTNEQAATDFLDLIEKAQQSIEIFDDGNRMDDSIYEKEPIVNAVVEKLHRVADFHVICYFNEGRDLLFTRRLEGLDRVTIHADVNPGGDRPTDQVHYKIVDGGRFAYLSRHGHAEVERTFKRLDCSKLKGKDLTIMAEELFGEYRQGVREAHARSQHGRATA